MEPFEVTPPRVRRKIACAKTVLSVGSVLWSVHGGQVRSTHSALDKHMDLCPLKTVEESDSEAVRKLLTNRN